jgi:hypothetical protein
MSKLIQISSKEWINPKFVIDVTKIDGTYHITCLLSDDNDFLLGAKYRPAFLKKMGIKDTEE